ncbi:MAG: YHS domain-containing (seleno)protein [Pseudomonadota bacterium]
MNMPRRSILALGSVFLLGPSLAGIGHSRASPVIAGGFDVIGYFDGKPQRGTTWHAAEMGGNTYRFASSRNRDRFLAAPQRFAPAYEGHCAYGVRMGQKFRTDPSAFDIVEGRLFLFLDPGTQSVWRQSPDRNIAVADGIWSTLKAGPF